ncbi:NAD(P)-dependent dehydrogenase, short-chain alcohol dehydrogenase family [Parafrankia irregularis]|uniref:NAD(P)-dependent dehydrogenase, short-chain alcohol dehydrogenase family n=1 Tax=Parafrankia irregularis TaxID=795642 RepID=A0A0S4QPE3_9ACTN|nr:MULTISPECIES: SDR family oxidoreductase [Parafrankia]MBE3201739.1 SDR family oxidoreductase [Parafrankia sp. CH37]CUU57489.1 NAD(P)-dependent dehydrogenase, short-chain alcohol dehydrogenase family [Parafrankia irregularis]
MIGDRLRLDGRTVVVAGAGGSGIGTAVCVAAVELGANVVGIDLDTAALADAEAVVGDVVAPVVGRDRLGTFRGVVANVLLKREVDAAVADAVAAFGSVDGLVHVVGGQRPRHWQPLDDFPVTDLDEVIDLNLRSALLTSQAAARAMTASARGGSIVHIASVAGLVAAPFSLAYGVGKAGLLSLTRTAAAEWGPRGIRVNAVGTGTIRTPHSRGNDAADAARDAVLPLRRRGTVEELAGAVMFLLSDLAGFVTGQTLVVDGGSTIRPSYLGPDDIPVFMEDGELRQRLLQR